MRPRVSGGDDEPRVFRVPLSPQQAADAIDALLESPGYWETLRTLVEEGGIAGPRIHDARIAAVCLTNGVRELWTADRDFSRFPALKVHNPCAG
jgi:hypothetical protein